MDKNKDVKCGFCKRGKEVENICSKLWCNSSLKVNAHQRCMQYSALLIQYKMKKFGGFKIKKVQKEINRGTYLRCFICSKNKNLKNKQTGATSGCAIYSCKKTFHYYCACIDREACTKKILYSETKEDSPKRLYRVFCSKDHEKKFCANLKDYEYASDTDIDEYNNDSATSFSESSDDSNSSDNDDSTKLKVRKNKEFKQPNNKDMSRKSKHINNLKGDTSDEEEIMFKKANIITESTEDIVYIVCFLESSNTPDTRSMQILKQCASKLFAVEGKNVFLWQYDGIELSQYHVIYLLMDISKCLNKKNHEELYRLMTQLNDEDIKQISDSVAKMLSQEDECNFYAKLRKEIAENFIEGSEDNCMGKYVIVNKLQEKYVCFVKLNDSTDPFRKIRKAFGASFEIIKKPQFEAWKIDEKLRKQGEDVIEAESESNNLFEWMTHNGIVYKNIQTFPNDEIIKCLDKQLAINRLKKKVESELEQSSDGSEIVFILRTPIGIINYSEYVKRRIQKCVDILLTSRHDVIVVVDLSAESVTNLRDLVCKMRKEIVCNAYTAKDVTKVKLSCAVLHFTLKT